MELIESLVGSVILVGRTIGAVITRPYETYRSLVQRKSPLEIGVIFLGVAGYFALASIVKTASLRPLLLSRQFVVLFLSAVGGYVYMVGILWNLTKRAGGRGTFVGFSVAWSYTLVPTMLWFITTSFLYLILPPPRSSSPLGVSFSVLYLGWSILLFIWKGMLLYLTLRFGARLDLPRILLVIVLAVPFIGLFSWLMYTLGVFKIPFL